MMVPKDRVDSKKRALRKRRKIKWKKGKRKRRQGKKRNLPIFVRYSN
jgi:hypothetical protein